MKKLTGFTLVLLMVMSSMAFAQPEKYDAGIFFDQAGATFGNPVAFTQWHFYAMAFDLDGQVKGYEFGVTIPAAITVLGSVPNPPSALNLGPAPANWIVGTGLCMTDLPGEWFQMVDFTGLLFAPAVDLLVCMTAATPSSFVPATPGYLKCDGSLVPFGVAENGAPDYPNGCMVLGPTGQPPVANDAASWGAVKAQY
jgi:hypothetical protein